MANYPVKLLKDKDGTAFIPVVNSDSIITPEGDTLNDLLEEKQDLLTSGTNIKTINNESLLGSGNISIQGGSGASVWGSITGTLSNQTDLNIALNSKADVNSIPTRTSQLTNDSNFVNNLSTSVLAGDGLVSTVISDNNIYLGLEEPMPSKTSDLTNDSGFINSVKTFNNINLVGSGNVEFQEEFANAVIIRELTSAELNEEATQYDVGTAAIQLAHEIGMFDLFTGQRINYNTFLTRATNKIFYVSNTGMKTAESCTYSQYAIEIICGSTLGDTTISIEYDDTYDYTSSITGGENFSNIVTSFQNFIGYDDNRIYDYSSTSAGYVKGMFVKDSDGKIYKCLMTGSYPLTNTSAWQRIDFYDVISKESDIVYYNKSDIMGITSTGDDVYQSLLEAIESNIAIGIVSNSEGYTSYYEVLNYYKFTNDDSLYFIYIDNYEFKKISLEYDSGNFGASERTITDFRDLNAQVNTNTINLNNIFVLLGLETNTYDDTSTYDVGDLVIYNRMIYECNTAITIAESWDSSHWDLVPVFVEE